MVLGFRLPRKEPIMKPRLIDRLLTICLCLDLALAFWCLSLRYAYHETMFATVF